MEFDEQQVREPEPDSGSGKLLGIFLGLVVLCAVFFGLGYIFGKNSAPIPMTTLTAEPRVAGDSSVAKPSAVQTSGQRDFRLVKDTGSEVKSSSAPATPAVFNPGAAPATTHAAPEMAHGGGSIVVQVAAVSKEEDADALVNALQKKNYPVFVLNNVPGDKLFHVQVGPFAELKDAEAIRARLAGDGYNAIVKK